MSSLKMLMSLVLLSAASLIAGCPGDAVRLHGDSVSHYWIYPERLSFGVRAGEYADGRPIDLLSHLP